MITSFPNLSAIFRLECVVYKIVVCLQSSATKINRDKFKILRISRSWVQVQKPYLDNVCSLKTWIILKSVFVYYIRKNKHTSKNTLPSEDRETWMNEKITYTQTIMYGLSCTILHTAESHEAYFMLSNRRATIIRNYARQSCS